MKRDDSTPAGWDRDRRSGLTDCDHADKVLAFLLIGLENRAGGGGSDEREQERREGEDA